MKKQTTRRSLLLSALSLLMCVSMLIGSTFAWFTDSVESGINKIIAGNLDVDVYYGKEEVPATNSVAGKENIFTDVTNNADILWEPGAMAYTNLNVVNEGTLALKYQLAINFENATTNANGDTLAKVLKVGFVTGGIKGATREAVLAEVAQWQALESFAQPGTLAANKNAVYGVVIYWEPSAIDNEFNMNNGKTGTMKIDLGINLVATQKVDELDSFGADYDDGAYIPVAPETIPAAGEALVLKGSAESNVTVEVPAAVIAGLDNEVTSLSVQASAPVVDTNNKTVSFTTVELVDQNGNEVDIAETGAKVTVILPVNGAFADGEQVEVYHDGSFVTYATVADGKISYEVSHFCEVEVKAAEEIKLDETIDSVKEFIAFAEDVNAGNSYAGKTVVLGADLDLAGVTWTPIGTSSNPFKGTFDGNGKVIKNLSVLMAGKSNVGLFGYTTDGEVKNVTVENAKIAGRLNVAVVAGTPYTTKYTNIIVKGDVEVEGMAYVGAVGGKNAYANWTDISVEVSEKSYVKANSIENGTAYRTYVGGVVGFNGEGGHSFTNITTNIDVIGSTCDVGGAFGIAHYGNKFVNVTVSGDVTITNAEEAAEAEEMGGIAGVWHNENGQTVTFTNCVFSGKLTANVAADLTNNTVVGAAYNKTGNGTLVIDGKAYVAVNTAEELVIALENKSNVIFVDNIKIEPAKMSNAYGKTGINVKYGQTIDGNGYTLNIQGAGGTWDSGINTTGGLIKNIKVTGSFRGIFINHTSDYSEKVVLDNVTLEGVVYTISCDQGLYQGIEATNCTFNGWTSFAKTAGEAKFVNCNFGEGSGYKYCRPYSNTEFVDCTFCEGYAVDTTRATITFTGCEKP